jgi:hypothetical protein
MTLELYKVLHVLGLALTALGLGAILGAGKEGGGRRPGLVLHGLGIVVLAVAGFGIMARLGYNEPSKWPSWLIAKMVVWLGLAASPLLVRFGLPRFLGWVIVAGLVVLAAWLALAKPIGA